MSQIRIVSDRPVGDPVSCVVSEYSNSELLKAARCAGSYEMADSASASFIMINPTDGHWSRVVDYDETVDVVECRRMEGSTDFPWWQKAVGSFESSRRSAAGVRIGIIDMMFDPPDELEHIVFVDPPEWQQRIRDLSAGRQHHGQRVSTIVGAQGPGAFKGLASDAELFFVDASFIGPEGLGGVDPARVVDGVRRLATTYRCDIINISCGFGQTKLQNLKERIDEAAELGTLCICAGGNTGDNPVETPANLPSTIGVGGVGFTEVAPEGSVVGDLAQEAIVEGLLGNPLSGWPGRPFHDRRTSHGKGIDVCAPSAGVVLKIREQISDLSGTSFASPIVAGVLACELSSDPEYLDLKGRQRYDRARSKLLAITRPIGLDPKKVGNGVPVMRWRS